MIGVGGGGGNTLNRMVQEGPGVERSTFLEYVACNTDMQALSSSLADTTITLGKNTGRGLGAGGVPAVGRTAAIDASAEIEALVRGVDMVFVTAGMGGGTGSGAAPVVAELAKQAGTLTVGIVTKPFSFEGRRRMQQALEQHARERQQRALEEASVQRGDDEADATGWTPREQRELQAALRACPAKDFASAGARWQAVAAQLPGRTAKECLQRCKQLASAVKVHRPSPLVRLEADALLAVLEQLDGFTLCTVASTCKELRTAEIGRAHV